ncbi:hemerythrin domain-containing protein [Desertibacillus haloalkaliphilus]|uniref:hemerythrin domain-containing protein n=1 Tax=Desertibacillus haloalkaliphilus TaxID=1328930 RepID=UPI001C278EAC|nr:hemerythrin domain-containing protein [Desertibacillus haloalkaliphilus]MBU8907704.1 hemerythrin domain-containing protein [Desertibacillus haloalkaliphilus]
MDLSHACHHHSDLNHISEEDYCEALKQLKKEHGPLRQQMDGFYNQAKAISNDNTIENWNEPIHELYQTVISFVKDLDPHSAREEDTLFPMLAKHIGYEGGPIAVMEYEHDLAKENIRAFIELVNETEHVTKEIAMTLINHLHVAYTTLVNHFAKEEQILFPMAEKALSQEEKDSLLALF